LQNETFACNGLIKRGYWTCESAEKQLSDAERDFHFVTHHMEKPSTTPPQKITRNDSLLLSYEMKGLLRKVVTSISLKGSLGN